MLYPIVLSLALSATAELEPSRGFCAFPATASGGGMLQMSLQPGADRARPRSRHVWLELGDAQRLRARMRRAEPGDPAELVIRTEDLGGELTLSLRADGRALLRLLPEGRTAAIEREGRCGGVASLRALLARG